MLFAKTPPRWRGLKSFQARKKIKQIKSNLFIQFKLKYCYLFISDMSAPLVDLGGHAVNIGNSSVEPPLTQDATTILLETIAAIIGN